MIETHTRNMESDLVNHPNVEKDDEIAYMYHFSDAKFDKFDLSKTQYGTHFNLTTDKQWIVGNLIAGRYEVGDENDNGYLYTVTVQGFNNARILNEKGYKEQRYEDDEEYAATLNEPLVYDESCGHLMVFDPSRVKVVKTEPMRDFFIISDEFNINTHNRYNLYYRIRKNNFAEYGRCSKEPLEIVTKNDLSTEQILKVIFDFIEKDKKQGSKANAYNFVIRDSSNNNMAAEVTIFDINRYGTGGSISIFRFSKECTDSPIDKERTEKLLTKINNPYVFSQDEIESDIRFRQLVNVFEQTGQNYIELMDTDMIEKERYAYERRDAELKDWHSKYENNRKTWRLSDETKSLFEQCMPNFERSTESPLPIIELN